MTNPPESADHPLADATEILRQRMPSRLDARADVIRNALEALAAAGCAVDPFDRLFLDELISNAVIHGNGEDPEKTVDVLVFGEPARWGYEVRDEGAGFDWQKVRLSFRRVRRSSSPSGRGLGLIVAFGAGLHVLDGGRRVVVVRSPDDGKRE